MKGIPGTTNIKKHGNGFKIRVCRNGKEIYLGYGETLIIALMKRDWCKMNNWTPYPKQDPTYITLTGNGKFMIQKGYWKNGKVVNEHYGVFNTFKEAEKEVRLLKECNWDYEVLCNLPIDHEEWNIKGWGKVQFQTHKNGRYY